MVLPLISQDAPHSIDEPVHSVKLNVTLLTPERGLIGELKNCVVLSPQVISREEVDDVLGHKMMGMRQIYVKESYDISGARIGVAIDNRD